MKISILVPTLQNGGVQRILKNLADNFVKKENVEYVICDDDKFNKDYKQYKINNFNISKVKGDYKTLFVFRKLKKYLIENKPDILLVAPGFSSFVAILVKLLNKKNIKTKVIVIVDNKLSLLKNMKLKHRISFYLYKLLYKYADGIVAAHNNAKKDLEENLNVKNNVKKIYHPLIKNESIVASEHKWFSKNNIVCLAVGRLVEEKNFKFLIENFDKIVNEKNNVKLIILGDGILKDKLQEIINKKNLNENVELYGYTENVFGFMKMSDIFLLTSKVEAFGNVIVEALSQGMTVVSSNCKSGGPAEILENGEIGYLYEGDNAEEFVYKTLYAVDNRISRESAIARSKDFLIEKCAQDYIEFFKEVLEK